jgi:hypothetical protein
MSTGRCVSSPSITPDELYARAPSVSNAATIVVHAEE